VPRPRISRELHLLLYPWRLHGGSGTTSLTAIKHLYTGTCMVPFQNFVSDAFSNASKGRMMLTYKLGRMCKEISRGLFESSIPAAIERD
jgi:hypothetical protein